mgnify:CR=1 FL=1
MGNLLTIERYINPFEGINDMANHTNIWNINHNSVKECLICQKEFKVKWSHMKRRKCCSRECKDKLQRILIQKENNPNWAGGQFKDPDGYIKVRIGGKYVQEHILVWQMNKGVIPEGFITHHKNHKRDDNRIENLECMSASEHAKLHYKERGGLK